MFNNFKRGIAHIYWKASYLNHSKQLQSKGGRLYYSKMIKLFEGEEHAQLYTEFRPTYPNSVVKSILDYLQEKSDQKNYALDIGCGSGQSTLFLAPHFESVVGVDVSEAQILQAPKTLNNISFQVGPAEDLSFCQDSSVDLVTIAQAFHWMDRPVLYSEVKRVLKPGAVLAVYGYGNVYLDDEKASKVISKEVNKL